jgi:ectoine hydroxylase-related dioxygenase (phytanoyl-CoA dioxygenase family)
MDVSFAARIIRVESAKIAAFHGRQAMLSTDELQQYRTQGYVIRPILSAAEVAQYVAAIESALAQRDAHARMVNLQFLQPDKDVRAIQPIICHPTIHAVVADLLGGGDVVIDGASLFCAQSGVDYRQGWHRDLMQIPDDEIDPAWFTDAHLHNYVQVNLALGVDRCLWLVPGSHRRPFDAAEHELFGESKKMAPLDGPELRAGKQIVLQPGEAAFYNNNAVHRGYGGVLPAKRITIHLGFHSTAHAPTPHFGVLDRDEYTPEYLASLDPRVSAMLERHLAERARHPRMDMYQKLHQEFIRKEFAIK